MVYYYHATHRENVPAIMKVGLKPREIELIDVTAIWMTTDLTRARINNFGRRILEIDGNHLNNDLIIPYFGTAHPAPGATTLDYTYTATISPAAITVLPTTRSENFWEGVEDLIVKVMRAFGQKSMD